MKARLRRLLARATPRLAARLVFGVTVASWVVTAAQSVALGQFRDAAIEVTLAALVLVGAWMLERGAAWVDAQAARAESERDVAKTMADEVERYRDRLSITVEGMGRPKAPPSSRN